MRKRIIAAGLLLAFSAPTPAQPSQDAPSPAALPTPDTRAQDIVEAVLAQTKAPAAALIVVGPQGTLASHAAGVRRAGSADPVAVGDAWHIGSNAKAMTATLALTLAEDGVIDLSDTVKGVLGERYETHRAWADVTLRDLLQHRGGLPPNVGRLTQSRLMAFGAEDAVGAAKDRRSVLRDVLRRPPKGEVGTFTYSNLGYTLAGEMLQAATGIPFETLIQRRLFAPLGMEGAVFGAPRGPDAIRGHRGSPPTPAPGGFDNPLFMSPAGTISLPTDAYAAFLTDQLRGQMGLPAFLGPDSYALMAAPPEGGRYGLGWIVVEDGTLGHSGSNTVWLATAAVDPQAGRAAAVLTNASTVRSHREAALAAIRAFAPPQPTERDQP